MVIKGLRGIERIITVTSVPVPEAGYDREALQGFLLPSAFLIASWWFLSRRAKV